VRIIKPKTAEAWAQAHAPANTALRNWMAIVRAAEWKKFADLRKTLPSADQVTVAGGRTIVVFNLAGNQFRLITAVHYRTALVFALRFLTHAEYDKEKWKTEL